MLIRDNVINIESINTDKLKKAVNKSEYLLEVKKTISEKVENIVSNSITTSEGSNNVVLQDTVDIIEILLTNLQNQGIDESELVKVLSEKKKAFGSYKEGYIK